MKFSADVVRPVMTGVTRSIAIFKDAAQTATLKAQIPEVLNAFEAKLVAKSDWTNEQPYVASTTGPTIADIQVRMCIPCSACFVSFFV